MRGSGGLVHRSSRRQRAWRRPFNSQHTFNTSPSQSALRKLLKGKGPTNEAPSLSTRSHLGAAFSNSGLLNCKKHPNPAEAGVASLPAGNRHRNTTHYNSRVLTTWSWALGEGALQAWGSPNKRRRVSHVAAAGAPQNLRFVTKHSQLSGVQVLIDLWTRGCTSTSSGS